jgi:aminoglycoside N3'-acetyltransferase
MIRFNDIVAGFKEVGLEKGDVVLVHSSFKSFGGVESGPQTVINALLDVLGEEGTLIVPTFNFQFCRGETFDVRETPSHMGIISELIRKNPKSRRVFHPIYSFAILGKLTDELGSIRYKSSYGRDSIFGKLRDLDGKIMIIGLSYNNSMTFFHHVEEMEGCDWRYFKKFTGTVVEKSGRSYEDTFIMLVRDLGRGIVTAVDPMGEVLEREGVVSINKIGESTVKLMKANDVYRITAREMKNNPKLLYQIEAPTDPKEE